MGGEGRAEIAGRSRSVRGLGGRGGREGACKAPDVLLRGRAHRAVHTRDRVLLVRGEETLESFLQAREAEGLGGGGGGGGKGGGGSRRAGTEEDVSEVAAA